MHQTFVHTQVIPYWIAQMLGAFFSSVMLYAVYVGKLLPVGVRDVGYVV